MKKTALALISLSVVCMFLVTTGCKEEKTESPSTSQPVEKKTDVSSENKAPVPVKKEAASAHAKRTADATAMALGCTSI